VARFERPYELSSEWKFTGVIAFCAIAAVPVFAAVIGGSWPALAGVAGLGLLGWAGWRGFRAGVYVADDAVRVTSFWPRRSRTLPWGQVVAVESRVHPDTAGLVAFADGIHLILADGSAVPTPLVRVPADVTRAERQDPARELTTTVPLVWRDARAYEIALRRIREWQAWGAYQAAPGTARPVSRPELVSPVQEVVRYGLFRRERR
jgi:hypothetical protein